MATVHVTHAALTGSMSLLNRKSKQLARDAGAHSVYLRRSGTAETIEERQAQAAMIRGIVKALVPEARSVQEVIAEYIPISQKVRREPDLLNQVHKVTGYYADILGRLFAHYWCRPGDEPVLVFTLQALFREHGADAAEIPLRPVEPTRSSVESAARPTRYQQIVGATEAHVRAKRLF